MCVLPVPKIGVLRVATGIDHEDKSSSDSADEGARLKGLEEK